MYGCQIEKGLWLLCYYVSLARLDYVSQKSLSYVFLVRLGHVSDCSVISEEQKYSNSHFVLTRTCLFAGSLPCGWQQLGLQTFHLSLNRHVISLTGRPDVHV